MIAPRKPLIIRPGQGRNYDMGRMHAVFHADAAETGGRYSISEWWLEPRASGVGTHSHDDDHIFYVLAGTLSLLINGEPAEAPRGSCVLIPSGDEHAFDNRGPMPCGFITVHAPAGSEQKMPDIVACFVNDPPHDVGGP